MAQENSTTQQQQMAEEVAEQQQIVAHKDSTKHIAEEVDEEQQQRLKYLQFVQVAAVHTAVCFTNAYGYAKEKSGPLRTGVESMEGAVKTVVGPVYDKYNAVPANLLAVADRKVDESVTKLAASQAMSAAKKAPETARSMYSKYEPRTEKCTNAAKSMYAKYEPKAEKCAVCAWRKLNELPGMPKVAEVVVPTAAYCSEKYNHAVLCTAEKGYKVAAYMPLVPMEKFAKAHCA